jgi:thiol-disulfide isomerase/thioredoxin
MDFRSFVKAASLPAVSVFAITGITLADNPPPGKPAETAAIVSAAAAKAAQPTGESNQDAVLKALGEAWPDRPEWLDMFADIIGGSQLGPTDGWFRRAVSSTKFDWKWASGKFDADDDGIISRKEFSGDDADFARLDRNADKAITSADFDFSDHALMPSTGMSLFRMLDRDGNGKLTKEELSTFFERADSGELGFLSLSDVKNVLDPKKPAPSSSSKPKAPTGPTKETLIRGLFSQEIGSLQPGPAVGEKSRDFTLKTPDGKQETTLSKLVGPKPVVLVFGNFTCGPFRTQAGNIEKLYRKYKDRANFVMIYVREAHPTDGWKMDSNEMVGVSLPQPATYDERVKVAQICGDRLDLGFPILVDTIDDAVGSYYSGMPSRLYLIDSEGKVAFKNGRGPFGFKPEELEHSLLLMLQETSKPSAKAE